MKIVVIGGTGRLGRKVVVTLAEQGNATVWDDDAVREFFTTETRNLLAAEREAGVGHHLAVTIVGDDRLPDCGYYRAKIAQEDEIEDERTVVPDPHALYFGSELKAGELTPGDGARLGATDFDAWLAMQPQGVAR